MHIKSFLLTHKCVEALRLVVPVDTQEVDGHTSQHYGQADATNHRLRVQRENKQKSPEQQIDHRPHQADLKSKYKRVIRYS